MPDLEHCPFCGEAKDLEIAQEREETDGGFHRNWMVRCEFCGAIGPWADSEDGAIGEWNTREEASPRGN
jgi:Lar family restriction alleviation protein